MKCRLCLNNIASPFAYSLLLGRNVTYFECPVCSYVQTMDPTWLSEAYSSVMNLSDTGIMQRNLSNTYIVLATLSMMGHRKSQIVDFAAGHGFLVRLLRDIGIDALWADPYSENLVARGFEYQGEQSALVTAFEVFEHFISPVDEMEKLLCIAPNILLTTTLIPSPTPQPTDWWYYGLEHGQHIGFYRVRSLQYLADKFGLNLITDGYCMHFFSKKRYSYHVWKTFIKIASRIPSLFAVGLTAKTWSDHLKFSKESN